MPHFARITSDPLPEGGLAPLDTEHYLRIELAGSPMTEGKVGARPWRAAEGFTFIGTADEFDERFAEVSGEDTHPVEPAQVVLPSPNGTLWQVSIAIADDGTPDIVSIAT